jgi:hypothetical protein
MKTNDIKKLAQAYVQVVEGKEPQFEVPEGLDKEGVAHFMGKASAAHKAGKKSFEMGGKTYPVTIKPGHPAGKKVTEAEDKTTPCSKCEGSMENHDPDCPTLKKEGWDDMMKMVKDKAKEKGTGNFDKKKVSTGTVFTRKANKDGSSKGVKEGTTWDIFKRIMEKKDAHLKGAVPPEGMDSKMSKSEKDFVDQHGGYPANKEDKVAYDDDKWAKMDAKGAVANVKVAPKRPGDQTIGDKTPPKPKQ